MQIAAHGPGLSLVNQSTDKRTDCSDLRSVGICAADEFAGVLEPLLAAKVLDRSVQGEESMRSFAAIAVLACLLGLAACDSSNNSSPEASDQANSTPETQNAPVDRDPTPQTGTGGESQSTDPDGTVTAHLYNSGSHHRPRPIIVAPHVLLWRADIETRP
jgi:hypothetical protein